MGTINILGFGSMGRQIASCMGWLGFDVVVWVRTIHPGRMESFERDKNLMIRKWGPGRWGSPPRLVTRMEELTPAPTIEALAEDVTIKRSVVDGLPYALGDIPFFSNSSSISPMEITEGAHGLHFFNPICSLKFVETTMDISGLGSASVMFNALVSNGFEVIQVAPNRGYIGNYILFREIASALRLVDTFSYKTKTVDAVLRHMGRSSSIFDIIDLVGVDVTLSILTNLKKEDESIYISPRLQTAVRLGVLGKKTHSSIRSLLDDARPGAGGQDG